MTRNGRPTSRKTLGGTRFISCSLLSYLLIRLELTIDAYLSLFALDSSFLCRGRDLFPILLLVVLTPLPMVSEMFFAFPFTNKRSAHNVGRCSGSSMLLFTLHENCALLPLYLALQTTICPRLAKASSALASEQAIPLPWVFGSFGRAFSVMI